MDTRSPTTVTHADALGEAWVAFAVRCDPDPMRRQCELGVLQRLLTLSESLGSAVRFEATESRKNRSIVFVRTCDGKMLWKAIVQDSERKFELLPRGFLKKAPAAFAELAALWNRMPHRGAYLIDPAKVPQIPLRLIGAQDVWTAIEASVRWASQCRSPGGGSDQFVATGHAGGRD